MKDGVDIEVRIACIKRFGTDYRSMPVGERGTAGSWMEANVLVNLFVLSCKRFLAADAAMLTNLLQHGFTLAEEGWNFTLPQLHQFLVSQSGPGEAPAYVAFRKRLFNSPVNSILAEMGAEIVIAHSRGKVDLTTYRLQRQKK